MRKICVLLAMMFLVAAIVSPLCAEQSSASSVRIGDIAVMSFTDSVEFGKAGSADLNFNLYNYGKQPAIVRLEGSGDSPIKFKADGSVTVNGGSAVSVPATLSADRDIGKGSYRLNILITVIDSEKKVSTDTIGMSVNIVGGHSSDGYRMKFMGLIELPDPFDTPFVVVPLTIVAWLALAAIGGFIFYAISKRISRANPDSSGKTARNTAVWVVLIIATVAVQNITYVCGVPENVLDNVEYFCRFLYVIFGALAIWNLYKAFISGVFYRIDAVTGKADMTLIPLMNLLGKILIVSVSAAYILALFNVNLAGIIAGAGIAGLGVSLGAKPAINEFFSGLTLMVTRPFHVGDTIELSDGKTMVVKKFGVLKTEFVTSYSNDVITVLNSTLASANIKNITWSGERFRVKLGIKVPRDCDLELAKKLILESAYEEPNVITDDPYFHKPLVIMSSPNYHGGILLTLVFYTRKYGDNWDDQAHIRERVLRKMTENGILKPHRHVAFTVKEEAEKNGQ